MAYLKHYGIQGQKWGVRRYQNLDGTLTEEGRARYGDTTPTRMKTWGPFKMKTTVGYKNMDNDGIIEKMQGTHYGDNFEKQKRVKLFLNRMPMRMIN